MNVVLQYSKFLKCFRHRSSFCEHAMFIFESYSFDGVEVKMRRLFWLFSIVSFFKNSSERFLFVNWFMLFLRFWSDVADSLKRRSFDDLLVFRFVFFFIQVTVPFKVEMNGGVIVVETLFALIAWNMSFVFVTFLILFFFVCFLEH